MKLSSFNVLQLSMSNHLNITSLLLSQNNSNVTITESNNIRGSILTLDQIIACSVIAFSYITLIYLFISAANFTWCGLRLTNDPINEDEKTKIQHRKEKVSKQLITKVIYNICTCIN